MLEQHRQRRNQLILAVAIGSALLWSGVAMPLPVHAQTPDPATQLYVSRIGVAYDKVGGLRRLPVAGVDIVDGNGQPVNGALVVGDWSGCRLRERDASAVTETRCWTDDGTLICVDGAAVIWANNWISCGKPCYFTFTITSVSKQGMTYVPVAGKTTSSSQCR